MLRIKTAFFKWLFKISFSVQTFIFGGIISQQKLMFLDIIFSFFYKKFHSLQINSKKLITYVLVQGMI